MIVRVALLVLACALPAGVARAAGEVSADAFVRATTEEMVAALRANRAAIDADRGVLYHLVDQILLPRFDFERMSRSVLGRNWRSASEEQRKRFVEEFRKLLVRTYATALASYRDEKISVFEARERERGEVAVRTEVEQKGGPPIPIEYRLYRPDGGDWKVFDISIDGVSLVLNYRSTFAAEIRRGGMDGLISRLVEHNGKS